MKSVQEEGLFHLIILLYASPYINYRDVQPFMEVSAGPDGFVLVRTGGEGGLSAPTFLLQG